MQRRLIAVSVLVAALVVVATAAAAPAPAVAGKACTKAGGTALVAAKKLVCTKTGKKLLWKLAAPAVTTPAVAKPQTTAVSSQASEMKFVLSQTTVPHGTVVFTVKNSGVLPHDFSFGSLGGGTPMLQPGESATLTVRFPNPGKYTYICTVDGHQESGMIGSLTVT